MRIPTLDPTTAHVAFRMRSRPALGPTYSTLRGDVCPMKVPSFRRVWTAGERLGIRWTSSTDRNIPPFASRAAMTVSAETRASTVVPAGSVPVCFAASILLASQVSREPALAWFRSILPAAACRRSSSVARAARTFWETSPEPINPPSPFASLLWPMRMRSSWSSCFPRRCRSTSPIASASRSFRTCSTEGSVRKRTLTSVPPRKSTPQLRPRVNNAKRLATTAAAEIPMNRNFFPITSKLVLVRRWNCFTTDSPLRASDAQDLHAPGTQVGVEKGAGDKDVGIQVRQDADAQGHGKAPDRTRAVAEQEEGRDERRDVGVDDGAQGLRETVGHRALDGLPEPELFPDSLEDEHVGVHSHPDGQVDSGDSREGDRGVEIAHGTQEQQDI